MSWTVYGVIRPQDDDDNTIIEVMYNETTGAVDLETVRHGADFVRVTSILTLSEAKDLITALEKAIARGTTR